MKTFPTANETREKLFAEAASLGKVYYHQSGQSYIIPEELPSVKKRKLEEQNANRNRGK